MRYRFSTEPSLEPVDPDELDLDCGHSIYKGEKMYEWDGKWLCPDCFLEKVEEMTLDEIAELLNVEVKKYA